MTRDHDESGLDLARSIARSLARGRPRRRSRPERVQRPDPAASGSHPDDRDPQTLDATLGRLVDEQGWSDDLRVHGVFSRWDLIVGHDLAQHVRPTGFQQDPEAGGRLVVQADSTAWATQTRLLAATLVRRLNEELGEGTVRVVDVVGPTGPSWKRGRFSVRGGRGPRDTYG